MIDEPISSCCPALGKMHRMTPKWLWHVQGQKVPICIHKTPGAKFSSISAQFCEKCTDFKMTSACSRSRVPIYLLHTLPELMPPFPESALNDSKWPWHVQRQKYQYACYIEPPPIFLSVSLHDWTVFELQANFVKSAPNDPKITLTYDSDVQKYPYANTPRGPNFHPFSYYTFYELHPFFPKVHRMNANDFDIFKFKNTNMNATYRPPRPKVLYVSTISHFQVTTYKLAKLVIIRTTKLPTNHENYHDMFQGKRTYCMYYQTNPKSWRHPNRNRLRSCWDALHVLRVSLCNGGEWRLTRFSWQGYWGNEPQRTYVYWGWCEEETAET